MMRVSVIGTGFVGLVTGVGLASSGNDVTCVDVSEQIVGAINTGKPPIYEKGLEELLARVISEGRFRASTRLDKAVLESDITLLCVGTPTSEGRIDLSQVVLASEEIGALLRQKKTRHTVIVKSTVLPGTTGSTVKPSLLEKSGKGIDQIGIGMNPEFLREGNAVDDFMNPDRIVLGADDGLSNADLRRLYDNWNSDKIEVSTREAEMIKYANNCLLASLISLTNELANVASSAGDIDFNKVMLGVYSDKRWSPILNEGGRIKPEILKYLIQGCGFGGSCFPKDVQAMVAFSKECKSPARILEQVLELNREQPLQIVRLLENALSSLESKKIAIFGLAFKPGTNDMRESPAVPIIKTLTSKGAHVRATDPIAIPDARKAMAGFEGVEYFAGWEDTAESADAVVVITPWDEYASISPSALSDKLQNRVIIDARAALDQTAFEEAGFRYYKIGYRRL